MKQPWYSFRLLVIVLYIVFATLGSVAAQDEEENADPQPTDTGTPGLVDVANNLNLPTVPPPPNAAAPDSAPQAVAPPILPNTPTVPITEPLSEFVFEGIDIDRGDFAWFATNPPMAQKLREQRSDVVWSHTNPTNGTTINVFSDATFVVVKDKNGLALMTGYLGFVAADTVIALGEHIDGTRYAFHGTYYSAYTADGKVRIGNLFTDYTYDYDQNGKLLSLTDSDGGKYRVQVEDSGRVSIAGPDGYSVLSDETGAFELYNEAGNLVVAGDLNDANYDEFAQFEASTDDSSDTELDNSDNADSSGDYGGGDDSSAGDSGGDYGGGDDSNTGDSGGDYGGGDDSSAGDSGGDYGGGDDSNTGDSGGDYGGD